MELVVTILGIVCGAEFLGLLSFFVYLKLNKREKTTQVVAQEIETKMHEIDLVDKYREKVLELEGQRDKFWESSRSDMMWIKDTLGAIVRYLDGPFQEWMIKNGLIPMSEENKED